MKKNMNDDELGKMYRMSNEERVKMVSKKNNKIIGFGVVIFVLLLSIGYAVYDVYLNDDPKNNKIEKFEISNYLKPTVQITASDFKKKYQEALDNQLSFTSMTGMLTSGEYSTSHSVRAANTVVFEDEENNHSYLCLQANTDNLRRQVLICGTYKDFESTNYPIDFLNAAIESNIDLSKYSIRNSSSSTIYYINGIYYSRELVNLVLDWEKTKSF